ncbi:hypothetical protein LTR78_000095 [Recurvomyces mirabilis]|uniref:Xylanolytic transcriptional activator regulatory domain-containing protein n=1 Tax=Recurvomyces mirabilis TaxID=574656 RepID=A0AAE0WXE5_9PEZI|nr:hypothetical protein LTR78_000095 [Recurvomyces mirabilis]KAK5161752.1 hypothetical protein LTS14_000097 [Recurvomyces mirabilis]
MTRRGEALPTPAGSVDVTVEEDGDAAMVAMGSRSVSAAGMNSIDLVVALGSDAFGRVSVDHTTAPAANEFSRINSLVSSSPSGGSEAFSRTNALWPQTPSSRTIEIDEDRECLAQIVEVLQGLHHFETIRNMLHRYCLESKASCVPAALIVNGVETLSSLTGDWRPGSGPRSGEETLHFARCVMESTKRPLRITSATTPEEYLRMNTGANLRLEYLGTLYAIGGRAYIYEESSDGVRPDFVQAMYRYSAACRALYQKLAAPNDAGCWHALEQALYCSHVKGDKSEDVWRALGDVSSDVLAAGYHNEKLITQDTPFFLAETRRRVFVKAYVLNMALSSLFDRPPRISRRYSSTLAPLNLSDDEVLAEPEQLRAAQSRLSADGWDMSGPYYPSSFIRMRLATAEISEEILDQTYQPSIPGARERLQALSARSCEAWRTLPPQLKYKTNYWTTGLPPKVCQMLMITYLGFATTDFHIYRALALAQADPQAMTPLIQVSFDVVTMLMGLGEARIRDARAHRDFSYLLLLHGMPAAVVLIEALQKMGRQRPPLLALPEGITRASLVRTLSIFVGQLDTACEPSDTNKDVCTQASDALSRALDDVLNAPMVAVENHEAVEAQHGAAMTGYGNEIPDLGDTQPIVTFPDATTRTPQPHLPLHPHKRNRHRHPYSSGHIPVSGLLPTCKTIREEAKLIFYVANTFRLTVDDNTPHNSHAFLTRISKEACKAMAKVIIRYKAIEPSAVTHPRHSLQNIHHNLKATQAANPFKLEAFEEVKNQIIAYWHGWAGWLCWVTDKIGGLEKLEHEFNADYDPKDPLKGKRVGRIFTSLWDHHIDHELARCQDPAFVRLMVRSLQQDWARVGSDGVEEELAE